MANNIHTQFHRFVSSGEKEDLLGQKGMVLWMYGLSGAGKSTIAAALERELHNEGRFVVILDGDNFRHGLNSDLGFSDEDRSENVRRVAEVAKMFALQGVIVVVGVVTSQFKKPPARCASVIWFSMVAVTLPSVSSNRYLPRKHCTSNVGDAGPENSRNASDSTLAVASQLETTVSTARLGAPYSAMFSHPMVARAELIGPQLSSTELIAAAWTSHDCCAST